MPNVTIYHNPRCSKSRQTLALIEEQGISPKIVEYLKQPLTVSELSAVLDKLHCSPQDVMRHKEAIYAELDLGNSSQTDEQLLQAMVDHPILIERPIVIVGNQACLGRPPENVLEILK